MNGMGMPESKLCENSEYVNPERREKLNYAVQREGKSFFFLNSDRPVMSNHTIVSAGAVGNPVHPLSSNFSRNYFFITVISLFICL